MRLSCRARRRIIVYCFSGEIRKEMVQHSQNYCLPLFSGEIRKGVLQYSCTIVVWGACNSLTAVDIHTKFSRY